MTQQITIPISGFLRGGLRSAVVTLGAIASLALGTSPAGSQEVIPEMITETETLTECAPPAVDTYNIFVATPTPAIQTSVANQATLALGDRAAVKVCLYQGQVMSQVGTFRTLEAASNWQTFLKNTTQLDGVIVQTQGEPEPTAAPEDTPIPFTPKVLSPGFAVILDFRNDPQVARQIAQGRSQPPGLVVYGDRPYLLMGNEKTMEAAKSVIQQLGNQGYWMGVVPSETVVLLKEAVVLD